MREETKYCPECGRIADHAFESIPDKHDQCANCLMPEVMHEWTVGSNAPNPMVAHA